MTLPLYYNWRNLLARRLSTTLMFVVVSVVVFVLALLLSFAAGIRASLVASGSPLNVLVLKPGATAESTSILRPDEYAQLVQTPGLARTTTATEFAPADTLLMSPEVCVQTTLPRRSTSKPANVAIRGVDDVAFLVHPEVRLIEGRRCTQGALEAIVGKAARDRFAGLMIGDEIRLGRKGQRTFRVVGVFEAAGSALESEVWAPRGVLADVYWRRFASSVCLRLTDPAVAPQAIAFANSPAVQLEGHRETDYYDELASKTREIVVLATVLVGIMAIGAIFAVANTMYAAVDSRRRELAMLRTIGFSRGAIMLALVLESLLICTTACIVGLAASTVFNGSRQDYLSDATWTVLSYEPRLTPGIVAAALGVATLVGVGGAVTPAIRAARINILQAVRNG
jgi:ABC-type lipoprotein release transport system permease subunit